MKGKIGYWLIFIIVLFFRFMRMSFGVYVFWLCSVWFVWYRMLGYSFFGGFLVLVGWYSVVFWGSIEEGLNLGVVRVIGWK